MKEIQLTRGKSVFVDDEDYEDLAKYKWHTLKGTQTFYAVRWSKNPEGKRVLLLMHRIIMDASPNKFVDHIDGNGLNDCKSNLRLCTQQENNFNKQASSNCSSRFLGVSLSKRTIKGKTYTGWRSTIKAFGKWEHIGYFKTEEEAATAYNERAKILFGEFARINKIDEVVECKAVVKK